MMYVLQCKLPGENEWADVYYDTKSKSEEAAHIVLTAKQKMLQADELMPADTLFQITQREF